MPPKFSLSRFAPDGQVLYPGRFQSLASHIRGEICEAGSRKGVRVLERACIERRKQEYLHSNLPVLGRFKDYSNLACVGFLRGNA